MMQHLTERPLLQPRPLKYMQRHLLEYNLGMLLYIIVFHPKITFREICSNKIVRHKP